MTIGFHHFMRMWLCLELRCKRNYNLAVLASMRVFNFCVSIIFPLIFNFPRINATCGFNFPSACNNHVAYDTIYSKKKNVTSASHSRLTISIISLSSTVSVASAFPDLGFPLYTSPFFKSRAIEKKSH